MRDSLKQSALDSPVKQFDRYPKGSIVLCNACAKPIFKLDRGIDLGQKAGGMASAFVPLSLGDLNALALREDIDAGIRGVLRSWTPEQRKAHINQLREVRAGDPMVCPCCTDCFVQVLGVEKNEVLDRAYTVELVTIPPAGAPPIRGKQLGYHGDWIHECR